MQAHHANLTFPSFTSRITIELSKHVVMFPKAFPPNSGISKTYIPHTIMTDKALDWKKSCKIHFGEYVQVQEDRNLTNTLEDRAQGSICLGPAVNLQGAYNLFLLRSCGKITCGKFTEVPTPTIVMKQVAEMDLAGKQNKRQVFENCTDDTVNNIMLGDEANKAFNEIDGNIAGVDWEAKIKELSAHMPHLRNNQYAALVGNEENEKNGDDQ